MSTLFTCPHCGTQTEVTDEYRGLSGPCAVCGRTVHVPPADDEAADASGPLPLVDPASGQRLQSVGLVLTSIAAVVLGATLLLGLILTIAWPVADRLQADSRRAQTRENLMRIAAAMQAYELDYGTLPPAYLPDAEGRPAHSWRVLLLPYLDQHELYRQYRFSEPWDGPQNLALLHAMPRVFACDADPDAAQMGETSFMVIVGDATLFPETKAASRSAATDGAHETLLVVQVESCGVAWTEPVDLHLDRMQLTINGANGRAIGSYFEGGAFVATADGQVAFLPDETPGDVLRGAATRAGGEYSQLQAFVE